MSIDEHGGSPRRMTPFGIDDGMAPGGYDRHLREADPTQMVGQPARAPLQILRMFGLRADAGKAVERLQFFQETGFVSLAVRDSRSARVNR
ncbi:MAG: hypothetical protein OEV99_04425 [Nitrospira sp.]|nr:hypothetical protein [Nitrospira sp.]MDH5496725.1 hypothetical protein [Nitrospira sp.]MDH5726822.1 hypothetical protein [Nitrospira sp.]